MDKMFPAECCSFHFHKTKKWLFILYMHWFEYFTLTLLQGVFRRQMQSVVILVCAVMTASVFTSMCCASNPHLLNSLLCVWINSWINQESNWFVFVWWTSVTALNPQHPLCSCFSGSKMVYLHGWVTARWCSPRLLFSLFVCEAKCWLKEEGRCQQGVTE